MHRVTALRLVVSSDKKNILQNFIVDCFTVFR